MLYKTKKTVAFAQDHLCLGDGLKDLLDCMEVKKGGDWRFPD